MIGQRADLPSVAFSVRVYQSLLIAYPTRFQQEYGPRMVRVFQDCCLRAIRQGGTNGMVRLWAVTLLDLIQSVISEHRQKEVQMKKEMKPEDIRLAGLALMWGAAAFVLGNLAVVIGGARLWGISAILITLLSMPLVVVGLLAVRNRYGAKVGGFGRGTLLAGSILGPLAGFIGLCGLSYSTQLNILGIMFIISPAVPLACLALFGIVALFTKPLPRWNAAPLFAGLWYPILIFAYITSSMRTGDWEGEGGASIGMGAAATILLLIIIQGIALAALGYVLKSDAPDRAAALA